MITNMDKTIHNQALQILRKAYGADANFREGQYEAIEATLTHRRTLVVQKTGWGKSLVYFVCTKLQRSQGRGITIVVSPLIVLMENQLMMAEEIFQLRCAVMNSSTTNLREEQMRELRAGELDLIFVTPETLLKDEVQRDLLCVPVGLFVVDEVHCISDWGHDFRLKYTRLNKVIRLLPRTVPVLGTTATANDRVIADMQQQFGEDVYLSRGPLIRDNLSIQILKLPSVAQRYAWLLQNIPRLPGSGIIYCLTQRDCEWLAAFLLENGIQAEPYHSGLDKNSAERAEARLRNNELKVLVATVKLGMGYDKSDIAFVIHYQQPANIVSYYQQIGRAGRNTERAYTFLMCGSEDENIQNYFIETAFPTREEAELVYNAIRTHAEGGLSFNEVLRQVNIPHNRAEKALMFLENEDNIRKEDRRYYPTMHPFRYSQEHYDKITAIRRREQQQMRELTCTKICLSRFVVNCLDDPSAKNCGICQNCLGRPAYPQAADISSLRRAQEYLDSKLLPIHARSRFPTGLLPASTIPSPNHEGICLSRYGHPPYGELVKRGKYGTPPGFCYELVKKSVQVLRTVVDELQIEAITCVPSLRSAIVTDFASKLARGLGIPFRQLLQKGDARQQKEMQNSHYQCQNALDSFSLCYNMVVPKRVILVDDIVDSRWTLTVCGYLLTQAGCELVFPFALADSSRDREDQE